jgi:protein involved in polysaccharide export with SLBB domain
VKTKWFFTCILLLLGATKVFADASLRIGDSIGIKIAGVPGNEAASVSGTYTIDQHGDINLPYIGKVRVAGMQYGEAQSAIENSYRSRDIFTNPTITVLTQVQARWVNIGGEVKAPQRVNYTADLTILSAINAAGGFTPFADQRKVRLLRGSQVTVINVKKIRGNPTLDIPVYPGDKIEVPQSLF